MKPFLRALAATIVLALTAALHAQSSSTASAPASRPIVSLPAGSPLATPNPASRKAELRRQALNGQLDQLFKTGKFDQCRKVAQQLLELDGKDNVTWYNLACIDARLGNTDKAMEALSKAVELGYSNLAYMDKDPDLTPLHQLPAYKRLLARDQEIQVQRARHIEHELKRQTGNNYIVETDNRLRLIFATNVDRSTLDEVKRSLTAEAIALHKSLFNHGFDQYLTVVIPSEADASKLSPSIRGFYDRGAHRLVARQIGMVLQHEFAHAVHGADQDAMAQQHPVWIAEGFSTFCESADFRDGKILWQENARLADLQQAIRAKKAIPLNDFIKYDHGQYIARSRVCYAQSRYLMLFLFKQGLLKKWYDAYTAGYDADPQGDKALQKVLGKSLPEIDTQWRKWVLSLQAPAGVLGKSCLGIQTLPVPDGLKITAIMDGSGAQKAGLQPGDILLKVDSRRVVDQESLVAYIAPQPVGRHMVVTYRRKTTTSTVTVTLGAVPWSPKDRPRK